MIENTYRFWSSSKDEPVGTGPSLKALSYYWKRGVWFQMPFGYQNPWLPFDLHQSAVDLDQYTSSLKHTSATGYDPTTGDYDPELVEGRVLSPWFAFWMPSLRYVERDLGEVISFRPCEAGREPPTDAQYVVKFRIDRPFVSGPEDADDLRVFRLAEKQMRERGRLMLQGLSNAEHTLDGSISGEKRYHIYNDTDDLAVMLSCSPYRGDERPVNPICSGNVWDKHRNLVLHVRFPSERGQDGTVAHWREPIAAAIDLAESWKLEGRPNHDD